MSEGSRGHVQIAHMPHCFFTALAASNGTRLGFEPTIFGSKVLNKNEMLFVRKRIM